MNQNHFNRYIGGHIKRARKEKGLAQKELADIANLPLQDIRHYEQGQKALTITDLCKITETLNISVLSVLPPKWKEHLPNPEHRRLKINHAFFVSWQE